MGFFGRLVSQISVRRWVLDQSNEYLVHFVAVRISPEGPRHWEGKNLSRADSVVQEVGPLTVP